MLHLQHTCHVLSSCQHSVQPGNIYPLRKESVAKHGGMLRPNQPAFYHVPAMGPSAHGALYPSVSLTARRSCARCTRSHCLHCLATDEQSSKPSRASIAEQLMSLRKEEDLPVGKLVCRAYEADDALGACVVLTRSFAGSPEEISIKDANKYVDRIQENIPHGIVYIAVLYPSDPALRPPNKEYRVVGTVALSLHEDTLQQIPTLPPPPNTAYLSNMAVDAKFRRLGVARALLAISEQAVAISGFKDLYLHVRQGDDPASSLYLTTGYQEVARDNFFAAQLKKVRPRVLMRKDVQPL